MIDLNSLNKEQKQAVCADLGPVLVVAGAGSGKTKVLTNRIAYLIENFEFDPNSILAITFTNKAAKEMADRLKKLTPYNVPWIGTFHGICLKILRKHIYKLNRNPDFSVLDEDDIKQIIKEIYDEKNISAKDLSYKNAFYFIDLIKNNNLSWDDLVNNTVKNINLNLIKPEILKLIWIIYCSYCDKLINYNCLDFNDLLNLTVKLLNDYNDIKQYWSNFFSYVLVDEFQDTNDIQFELIKLLINNHNNLFAVGDPDQTIYTWRGANQKIIIDFNLNFPDSKTIILSTNYRSNQGILDISNSIIVHNKNRIKKLLVANNQDKSIASVHYAISQDAEATWIANEITNLINNGTKPNEIAVLYRSKFFARPIEQQLIFKNIKYTIYGGFKFYQRSEIKDIIAYLNVICNRNEVSIKRIINKPRRKISDDTLSHVLSFAFEHKLTLWDALLEVDDINTLNTIQKTSIKKFILLIQELSKFKDKPLDELINKIIDATDYISFLVKDDIKESSDKTKFLNDLLVAAKSYMDYKKEEYSLKNYLQELFLYTTSDDNNHNPNHVSLMTIHNSKGLEFDYVFLSSFNEGDFPSARSIEESPDLEEERRIAYVAITRAKKKLFISGSYSLNYVNNERKKPSRFFNYIDKSLYEIKTINAINPNSEPWFDSKNKLSPNINNYFYNSDELKYEIGDKIQHNLFGIGTIIGIDNKILSISFPPPYNIKTIAYNHKSIKKI